MILRGEKNCLKKFCSAFAVLLALLTLATARSYGLWGRQYSGISGSCVRRRADIRLEHAALRRLQYTMSQTLTQRAPVHSLTRFQNLAESLFLMLAERIHLNGTFTIKNSNLTILGQTAPGDGITLLGGDISIASWRREYYYERYLRVRPTDINGGEPDGIGGRWNKNIILDHCSTSWGVDELLTLYAGSTESGTPSSNMTVQNCLATESLRMSKPL